MGTKSLPGQRHPRGVPWVNSALWCGRSPVRNPGGTPIFWPLPFRGDSLETKKGARELGLNKFWMKRSFSLIMKIQLKCNFFLPIGTCWQKVRCPAGVEQLLDRRGFHVQVLWCHPHRPLPQGYPTQPRHSMDLQASAQTQRAPWSHISWWVVVDLWLAEMLKQNLRRIKREVSATMFNCHPSYRALGAQKG